MNEEVIQWRSAAHSLPEKTDTMLIKVKAGGVFESFYQDGKWLIYGANGLVTIKGPVMFWTPMPSGPSKKRV
jgi:hypothetical protein